MAPNDPSRPLRLRVVDLTTGIAGGYCAKLLHDAGAEVTKVEPPGGDPLRSRSASGAAVDPVLGGPLFRYLHAGHRSVVADPATDEGLALVRSLAAGADLVLESWAPGVAESLGLGPEALHAVDPATTLVSISSFGRGGPWSTWPATEFTLQAWCGSLNNRGFPGRTPVGAGGRIGDWMAGTAAATAGAAAALAARRSGRGQHVDVSELEAMLLSFVSYQPIFAQFDDKPQGRSVEIPSIEPAADGWVGFCTVTRQQWSDFTVMIERPDLGEDEELAFANGRMANYDRVHEAIVAWTSQRTVAEIVELASAFRIPVSPVGDGRTVTEMDHLVERGVFVPSPAGFLQPRRPYRLGTLGYPAIVDGPRLDEHGAEVRAEAAPPPPPVVPDAPVAPRPLEGLKVVAFVAFWAGPFAASYLAALGADVVKVESIQRPDGMRFAGGVKLDDPQMYEWSGVSHGANVGVRAITLDLERAEGVDLAKRLVAGADVVLDNFSPRVLDGFGLGEPELRAVKPDVVVARIPAFGLDGPWRDRGGFAMTVEQSSGLAWRTGFPEGQPLVPRGACDVLGAYHLVLGLLAALEHRRETGEGLLVEAPLVEAALAIAAEQTIEWTANGVLLEREGNRAAADAAPQGVYPSADEDAYVVVSVETDQQWRALAGVLGIDPASHPDRWAAHDELDERIAAWTSARPMLAAVDELLAAGVPAAPTLDARRLNHLAQLSARGWFEALEHPVAGVVRYLSLPMTFSALPRPIYRRPAPTLGQHNAEVLSSLGVTAAELRELEASKVIGTKPAWLA